MAKEIKGNLTVDKGRFGIVVSRFNEFISSKLLGGALDALERHGAKSEDITIAWVPGSVEIPFVADKMACSGKYDAIICLGAVIRGSTSHYDYVCQQVTRGIAQINSKGEVPAIFGVLTCETIEQAVERAGTKHGNTGAKAAISAIEMVDLLKKL